MTFEEKDGNLIIGQMTEGQKADFEKFFNYYIYSATKAKNILPRPVIRDGNGKFTKNYSTRDWFLKLQEEIFEVFEAMESGRDDEFDELCAEEIADVITVCTSWLETLGYDEEKRSEIFRKVNVKNEKRGYFKEND